MLPTQNANIDVQVYMANKYRISPSQGSFSGSSRTEDEQFFQYVRKGKYKQAYTLGEQIMQKRPNHKSISNFCQYILKNMLNDKEEASQTQESGSSSSGSDETQTQESSSDQEEQSQAKTDLEEEEDQQSQQQSKSSQQSMNILNSQHKNTPKKMINYTNSNSSKRATLNIQPRYRPSPDVPKLTLNQNTNVVKQSLKNFINIRLNSENESLKQKRYTLQNNYKKSSLKLPAIGQTNQSSVIKLKEQSNGHEKQNNPSRKNSENVNFKKSGFTSVGKIKSEMSSKRVSICSNQKAKITPVAIRKL